MAEYAPSRLAPRGGEHRTSRGTVGWIVLAALLCGVGIFLMIFWLVTFYWWAFGGVALIFVGFLLFVRTWTGPESA